MNIREVFSVANDQFASLQDITCAPLEYINIGSRPGDPDCDTIENAIIKILRNYTKIIRSIKP